MGGLNSGYNYNSGSSSGQSGPATSLPSDLYPTQDNGVPQDSQVPANSSAYTSAPTPVSSPVVSGTPTNSGAPGSGTSGPPGTKGASTLGYESLIPYAGNAAYIANEENTQGQSITAAGDASLNTYSTLLNEGISSDPTVRMAQAAPGVQAQEAQTASAVQDISTLPRGGAQNYLEGQAYISEASNVGSLIDQAYNSDLTALGNLGTTEAQLGLSGEQAAVGSNATAASITGAAVQGHNTQKAADQAAVANDISMLAGLAIG